ncbi:MAG: lipid IV(A) 3-deoxy-D-manno-octulosonic acid transferase [Methylococcales bacterium]
MRLIYNLIITLISPLFFLQLLYRSKKVPAYRKRWNERLAIYRSQALKAGVIWFHAVSFGEAEAAFPLMLALKDLYPNIPQLITTTTLTGSNRIKYLFRDSVQHVYLPYDLPGTPGRFLHRFKPILGIIVETEIWPNLYRECATMNVPLAIINGRLSERSMRGYRKIPGLVSKTLNHVSLVAAQSFDDANRFIEIGADRKKVLMTGNIKFDYELPNTLIDNGLKLRINLFGNRPVWIAASTHDREEEPILDAFEIVRTKFSDLLLILAPRHPERIDKVKLLCKKKGFEAVLRSSGRPCSESIAVFLLDTMGELKQFYAAADVAFIGGSLVKTGGHNVLEAAALGVPVVFGPYMFNFEKIADSLVKSGAAIQVTDQATLARQVAKLLENDEYRRAIGSSGRAFVEENRGAITKTLELLRVYIDGSLKSFENTESSYLKSA